jgi:flagellar biosynthetic protein FlhB
MESSSQDRNLPASQRKLNKAKGDGQVARSRDLSHLAVLGGGAVAVMALAPTLFDQLKLGLSQQLSFDAKAILQTSTMMSRLQDMTLIGLLGCAVFAAIVMVASILSAVGSGGWVASLKPVMPDFSRLNPISGLGRLFTKEKFSEVAKMAFVMLVLMILGGMYFSAGLQAVASLTMQPSQAAIQALNEWLKAGMGLLLLVILIVAGIDVPLQNFLHASRLKMSHQEVKQEQKESEGSPQMKGRLRQRQREISHGNSIGAVVKADFVVMNPTHFAVAIRYDEKTMRAPQVISKGADLLAMKIRDIAKTNSIPVLQSPVLARALYANAELDQDIPSSLYTAVAQVLAYVYRLKSALRGDGPMPGDQPIPFVPPELDPQHKTETDTNQP